MAFAASSSSRTRAVAIAYWPGKFNTDRLEEFHVAEEDSVNLSHRQNKLSNSSLVVFTIYLWCRPSHTGSRSGM